MRQCSSRDRSGRLVAWRAAGFLLLLVLIPAVGSAVVLVSGEHNRMVAMQRGELASVPLADVADKQRLIPLDDSLLNACRAIGVSFGQ